MKGLFVKDLKFIMTQKKFFIMAIALAGVMTLSTGDTTFAATYIILLLSMLTLTTISYDDMNGGMLFLLSLPVDRKLYVKEKYVFAFANLVFAVIVSLLISICFGTIAGTDIVFDDLFSAIIGIAVGMSVMLGVMIPLELKYGAEKSRIAMIVFVVAVLAVGYGGYKLLTEVMKVDLNTYAASILEKLPKSGQGLEVLITIALLIVVLVVFFISYIVSARIMKKKEF